jgi:hypothetical protein
MEQQMNIDLADVPMDEEPAPERPIQQASPSSPAPVNTSGINIAAVRLNQNFADNYGVKRQLTKVVVGKVPKEQFYRVHPDPACQLPTKILEFKSERETYLLDPRVWDLIPDLAKSVTLRMAVDLAGNVYLTPVPFPDAFGRSNPWAEALIAAIAKAEDHWIRTSANMATQSYDMLVAEAFKDEPKWPECSFDEVVNVAFRGRYIETADHPLIKKLLGLL